MNMKADQLGINESDSKGVLVRRAIMWQQDDFRRFRETLLSAVFCMSFLLGASGIANAQNCDYDWQFTIYEGNCPPEWNGAGDGCDCGCQFVDLDCSVGPINPPSSNGNCDYDWELTIYEGNCPPEWNGAGDGCDCGCQYSDLDCGNPSVTPPVVTPPIINPPVVNPPVVNPPIINPPIVNPPITLPPVMPLCGAFGVNGMLAASLGMMTIALRGRKRRNRERE